MIDSLGAAGTFASDMAPRARQSLAIAIGNLPQGRMQRALASLLREGDEDLSAFELRLQQWFDQAMDRLSGDYKRMSQAISAAIGAAIAFTFQIDAIRIARTLWTEPDVRAAVSAAVDQCVQTAEPGQASCPAIAQGLSGFALSPFWIDGKPLRDVFLGCAITALAAMLGAPFSFDLLQRIASLRSSGKVPDRAPAPGAKT